MANSNKQPETSKHRQDSNWHTLSIDAAFEKTGAAKNGLSAEAVQQKLEEWGRNELETKKKKPAWLLFLYQFKDFMIIILMAAALVSGAIGEVTDAIVVVIIVILNAIIGFVQEYRAEKAMEALKKMATPHITVLRNGRPASIASEEIVPGDIVWLEAGNIVPADLRLTESHSLQIEESSLTGESASVHKSTTALEEPDLPLGDRVNMAYKGTQITNGRGQGIAIATGMNTELGHIAQMLQGEETVTPLQKRMADFGKKISWIILAICAVMFGFGLLRGEKPLEILLVAISLAVAAIPEALPALITIALARGAKRLVEKNALIRKLPAVETLGSVTFICSDKTGTLTQNKMTVVEIQPQEVPDTLNEEIPFLKSCMALNQDARQTEEDKWLGDPTEVALIEYVLQQHPKEAVDHLLEAFPRTGEIPFDSDRKCMTTIHRYNDRHMAICKGAAEVIMGKLKEEVPDEKIKQESDSLAAKGMRVLAYGYKILDEVSPDPDPALIENNLAFAGLVGMIDPPRQEAKDAIAECKTAGIKCVMITGDHPETAAAIASEIGILSKDDLTVTGAALAKFSEEELVEKVERIRVYARVSPEQKLNIVKALQAKKNFVAMTGDGVNDAPSLKTANIGIAMGITGTDVSKEAAHMILLDDNFATIVKAVKEGRRIYDNIRKFVKYIMSCNTAEILTIFIAPLVGLPMPLLPIHILWINLVTDGLPGLALSTEEAEKNIMQRPPRSTGENLFSGGVGFHIIWAGIFMAALMLGMQAWAINAGKDHWQTMVFTALSLAQLGNLFALRSDDDLIIKKGFFSNLPLVGAIVLTIALQLGVVYLPFANRVFKTQPLSGAEMAICFGVAVVMFLAVEIMKLFRRKKAA